MSERCYNWLSRKYGWSDETFSELDEDFQNALISEFCSIAGSY